MIQAKTVERLHAACDECRTRKLKCSGDAPKCVRCEKENIQCIYSPQKQMGRPRKRRREGEADELVETSTESYVDHTSSLIQPQVSPNFDTFGLFSSSNLSEYNYSSRSTGNDMMTPSLPDLGPTRDYTNDNLAVIDFGTGTPIDPCLWSNPPLALPEIGLHSPPNETAGPCTCLSQLYLTLTELQSVRSFAFPQIVIPLRKATSTLSDIIYCPQCPKDPFNAIQNIQAVVSLFKAIVERYSKVLMEVDHEAERLEAAKQKKPYRIGDNNPALHHLHTGTLDCPMGFNIELEPKDWRRIIKSAIKTEIYGGGSNPRPLLDLLKEAEARQKRWHEDKGFWSEERTRLFPGGHECHKDKPCHALGAEHIRQGCENLRWD